MHIKKILVVGKGGREHAIVRTIKKFNEYVQIFCAPGNGGTAIDAVNVPISEMDITKIKDFALNEKIDFVVVTPDNPLAEGMVDALQLENISCFGPTKQAARIESSKVFAKNLMKKYGIATADFATFDNAKKAIDYISKKNKFPIVIKADGLAYGKGVLIANSLFDATTAIENMMIKKQFQDSANQIVIEEFLEGPEVSVLCFADENTIKPMVSCMDHKKAFDHDQGPNTGGMGTIAPNPAYTEKISQTCMQQIFIPTIEALKQEGCPFCGCLYFGLMLTQDGPKVIEYNCRFGDPETQVILPLMETNLLEILIATSKNKLSEINLKFKPNTSAACVILASKGYPNQFQSGFEIQGLNNLNGQLNQNSNNIHIFHSGTKFENGKFKTNSGRVLSVVATAPSLNNAISCAYDAANNINFENKFYRSDIGLKAINIIQNI